MHENCKRSLITFYCSVQFIGETTLSQRLALCDILNGYLQYVFELTVIATGGIYKIIITVHYVLQLILFSYDLILHVFICLHFS